MSDSLETYLNELGRYPLLTPAQEIELSRQVRKMVALRDREDKNYTQEEERYIKIGLKAKAKLIRHNMRLVVHVCRKYWGRTKFHGLEMCDFVQEGAIGLDRAAEMFDGTLGYKFSTYAYWWIKQALRRAIDNKERLIRLPVHITEKMLAIQRFTEQYRKEHQRAPSFEEIAAHIEMNVDWVELILARVSTHTSLDVPIGSENDSCIGAFIPDPKTIDQDQVYEDLEAPKLHELIEAGLHCLDPRERETIILRYGLSGDYQLAPMSKIGERLGISRERARQILTRALMRLRSHTRRLASQPAPYSDQQAGTLRTAA